jgi:hypothetical protein
MGERVRVRGNYNTVNLVNRYVIIFAAIDS